MGLLGFRLLPKKVSAEAVVNNIFIGGMSATMYSPATLRPALGYMDASLITNVIVDGEDVSCRIDTDFNMAAQAFRHNLLIKWYIDLDGHCKLISDATFRSNAVGDGRCSKVYLPGCDNVNLLYNFYRKSQLREIVLTSPNLTKLGTDLADNATFGGLTPWGSTKLWVNDFLRTANGGSPDTDITYFTGRGGTVVYVTNYTPPESITGFTPTQVYDDSAQFTWTVPIATNGVMRYEIFVDDILKIETTKLTIRVAGLTNGTVHKVQIRAVDTFYNIGPFTTYYVLINGATITWENSFISYYNFDNNVLDTLSANTATAYNTYYEPGTSGDAIVLSGTSAYVDLNSTSIIGGKNAFSIVVAFKMNALVDNNVIYGSWAPPYCAIVRVHTGQLQFYTYTEKQVGGSIVAFTGTTEFNHLVATYDGDKMKMYLNGVLQSTTYNQTGATGTGGESEAWGNYSTAYGQYTLDSGGFLNKAVTQSEVDAMYLKFTQGEELIV